MTDRFYTEILLDSNMLILLVVGLVEPLQVGQHKNTSRYDLRDFNLLTRILASTHSIIFTPNIATEASNLLRQTRDPHRSELGLALSNLLKSTREVFIPSAVAMQDAFFIRLGLTDAVILNTSSKGRVLLTDDNDLYLAALHRGMPAINFSHQRAAGA